MRLAALAPKLYNWAVTSPRVSGWIKRAAGFAPRRSLPTLSRTTLAAWHATQANKTRSSYRKGRVYLFCDEFTDYTDTRIGIKAIELLNGFGYEVVIPEHVESGRAHFSKGLVRDAQKLAIRNVELLKDVITDESPLLGIEPSAILGFRDEYPALMPERLKAAAQALAKRALLIDEFIAREADAGRITSASFRTVPCEVKLHGHCHQKTLSSMLPTVRMLELVPGHQVAIIPSGCCGMAGSFGYEAEHFDVSQKIGELVLFPAVRAAPLSTVIAAPGTSCRHQIKDATGRHAQHPIEILHRARRF
jgi:Fe-S oxidoreductase